LTMELGLRYHVCDLCSKFEEDQTKKQCLVAVLDEQKC